MKKLLIYMKEYKKECVLGPFFKLLEATFDLIVPLVMAAMIDNGIAQRDLHYVLRYSGVLLLLAVVGLVCSITAQYYSAKAAVGFATKLRHALFAHVESLSFSEMDRIGTSTLITRMTSDINQMQSGINMALRLFLRSPFIVAGAVLCAFLLDWRTALVFVAAIVLLAIVIFGIMFLCMPLYKKAQAALDRVLGSTRENLTGVRVVRAFHREEEAKEEYSRQNDELAREQLFVGRIAALTNPVTYVLVNLALAALLWVGAVRIELGTLTQGEIIALINYLSQILVELIKLANAIVMTNKALACADRIQGILEEQSSLAQTENLSDSEAFSMRKEKQSEAAEILSDGQSGRGGRVEFCNAALCYQGAQEASVEGVTLTAEPGQTIGIIGGTGSGKSSLVHLIPRFYDATQGCVRVDGRDVRSYPLEKLREKVGIVMQKAVLFQGSIRDNLLWGREGATQQELWEALELSQAAEFVKQKRDGIDSYIEQGGRNLSGGQRQRLTIARALVRKPEILILDDSTSALDYATDAKLRRSLRSLDYHPTIFMVSQRTSSIRHADRILVLEDGRVIAQGTHEQLLRDCALYAEIHYSQYQKEA